MMPSRSVKLESWSSSRWVASDHIELLIQGVASRVEGRQRRDVRLHDRPSGQACQYAVELNRGVRLQQQHEADCARYRPSGDDCAVTLQLVATFQRREYDGLNSRKPFFGSA